MHLVFCFIFVFKQVPSLINLRKACNANFWQCTTMFSLELCQVGLLTGEGGEGEGGVGYHGTCGSRGEEGWSLPRDSTQQPPEHQGIAPALLYCKAL